ncbi:hypothetical protein SprV_0301339600 [Sparganum proliferum]
MAALAPLSLAANTSRVLATCAFAGAHESLKENQRISITSDNKVVSDLEIETIELLLQSKYDETENRFGHAQVLQLLKFCFRTYFTFDRTIYEPVKSTPMGSPISGFIAEAVL